MITRFLLALALLLAGARGALAAPSIWTVHGENGAAITLFGSVHVLPQGLDWEPPALASALTGADELWFEVPVDATLQSQAVAAAQARGLLPAGQSLTGLLSAGGGQRLRAEAADFHLPIDTLDRMQPWFADLIVSSAVFLRAGARPDQGVEQQLARAAPQAERKAFETVAQQVGLLADAPRPDQIAALESTLRETAEQPDEYAQLVSAWMRGDNQGLYQHDILSLKHDAPALFRILITQRNAAWTQALAERLRRPGKAVVVVGVGHLLGPGGVPARLRALGFRVDGPAD